MNYTKGDLIYGTTCPSCGVFTPDCLAYDPKGARLRRAAPNMYEALKEIYEDEKITKLNYIKIYKVLAKAEGKQ